MKLFLLILIGLIIPGYVFGQQINQDFPSRLEFSIFCPKYILAHRINEIRISDHMIERISIDYELQYNKNGLLETFRIFANDSSNKSKRIKIEPIDTIFYNLYDGKIEGKNRTAFIERTKNKNMIKVSYHYKQLVIGCPIKTIYFQFDSVERISKDIFVNCLDSTNSKYEYKNDRVVETDCITFKTDRYSLNPKDTINEIFKFDYDSSGLLKGIRSLSNPEIFKKYDYILKK